MTPMEFTLQTLANLPPVTPPNLGRTAECADKTRAKVLQLVRTQSCTSEHVAEEMGFSKSTAKLYLRSLVLDGSVKAVLNASRNKPALYVALGAA